MQKRPWYIRWFCGHYHLTEVRKQSELCGRENCRSCQTMKVIAPTYTINVCLDCGAEDVYTAD